MKSILELLPEKLSDEEAYNLVNFFMDLALELESHYFTQLRCYVNDKNLTYPDYLQNDIDDKLPF
jgi:hypothetical protein